MGNPILSRVVGGAYCVWCSAAAAVCWWRVVLQENESSARGCAKLNCFIKNLPYWSDSLLLFCPFCPIFFPLMQSLIRSLNHRTGHWVLVVGQRNTGNLFDLLIWWCVMISLMTYSIFVAIQGDYGLSRLYQRHLVWAAVRSTQEGGPNQK